MTTKAEQKAERDAQEAAKLDTQDTLAGEDNQESVQSMLTDAQINELSVEQIDALIKSVKAARRGAGKSEAEAEYKTLTDAAVTSLLEAIEGVSGKLVGTLDLRVRLDRENGKYVMTKAVVRISNMDVPKVEDGESGENESEDGESESEE